MMGWKEKQGFPSVFFLLWREIRMSLLMRKEGGAKKKRTLPPHQKKTLKKTGLYYYINATNILLNVSLNLEYR